MWVPKLLLSPVKIRNFGPKSAKFGPKIAFLAHFVPGIGQICFLASSFGALLVGGCGAGCISQDTYLLYMFIFRFVLYFFHSFSLK